MDADVRVRPAAKTASRRVDRELVVVNVETGDCFSLDEVAARMWEVLAEKRSVRDAGEALCSEFDAEPNVLRADLEAFVASLREKGLLEVDE